MKKMIILGIAAALSVVFTVEWASARGNHRSAIDGKWKQVQAWQEKENKEFKAIEREAQRSIRGMDDSRSSGATIPSHYYQWQCP